MSIQFNLNRFHPTSFSIDPKFIFSSRNLTSVLFNTINGRAHTYVHAKAYFVNSSGLCIFFQLPNNETTFCTTILKATTSTRGSAYNSYHYNRRDRFLFRS